MSLKNTHLDGEIKREQSELAQEVQKGVQIANETARIVNSTNIQQQARLRQNERDLTSSKNKLMYAQQHVRQYEARVEQLEQQLEQQANQYEALLCKPMLEIAQHNGNFKATYEAQMQIMADWMVSQKAFKELAIQFGFDKGLSPEKVIEMGYDAEIDVLENKHDPSHNTNAGTDENIITRRKDELIKKFHESKRK